MGVEHEACVAYGVYFTDKEDIQELLKLTADEYEDLVDENLGCYLKFASGYDKKGMILYLPRSFISINRYNDQYAEEFDPRDFMAEFWSAVGEKIATQLHKLHKIPKWYLMYRLS